MKAATQLYRDKWFNKKVLRSFESIITSDSHLNDDMLSFGIGLGIEEPSHKDSLKDTTTVMATKDRNDLKEYIDKGQTSRQAAKSHLIKEQDKQPKEDMKDTAEHFTKMLHQHNMKIYPVNQWDNVSFVYLNAL